MEKKTFNEWCTSGSNRGTRGEVDEIKSKYNDFIDECIKKLENKKGASYKSLEQNDDRMSTYMSILRTYMQVKHVMIMRVVYHALR